MTFSIEELQREYIDKIKAAANAAIQIDYDGPGGTIDYIDFTFEKNSLSVRFYGFETALFLFDEKIMLVDDIQKTKYTLDHTYGNVVYDGALRNLTHSEILRLLAEITECFIDCVGVTVISQEIVPSTVDSVGKNHYKIYVSTEKPETGAKTKIFSNIEIVFVDG